MPEKFEHDQHLPQELPEQSLEDKSTESYKNLRRKVLNEMKEMAYAEAPKIQKEIR